MGINQRRRKMHDGTEGGRIIGGGTNVDPPFCPFIGGIMGQPVAERIVAAGAKEVTMQFRHIPMQCLGKNCMLWGQDEDGGFCMMVEAVEKLLSDDSGEKGPELPPQLPEIRPGHA